jgi:uncharacterized membrane protein
MSGFVVDALTLLLRWLHVVAAIAWIGESFYFVMLDRALKAPRDGAPGVAGELWSVHGGGFYHKQKYAVAPARLPAELHWSMWKSYTTWLSGFALFAIVYLASPAIWLVDPAVHVLTGTEAVAYAIAFPVFGWVAYDLLCRAVGFRDHLLGLAVSLLVLALCYAATHLFAGRAAFLMVGIVLGTIMSANVFFVIIPGQRRMVAALRRGETPDPLPGRRGRQRSVHNTYFTLPVVFAMLSTHYAVAAAHPQSWLVLALFLAAGALIRQFFVSWHSGGRAWGILIASGVLLLLAFAWLAPRAVVTVAAPPASVSSVSPRESPDAALAAALAAPVPTLATVQGILERRCAGCHAEHPKLMASAPLGAKFETAAQIETHAARIHQQTVALRVMPPGNLTALTDDERAAIDRWFRARDAAVH